MTYKSMVEQLEKHKKKIGKERDHLQDLQYNLEALTENVQRAYELVDEAIDILSELV